MLPILLLVAILSYSSWILYRYLRDKLQGKCDSCSSCSLNGACPLQQLKAEGKKDMMFILDQQGSNLK